MNVDLAVVNHSQKNPGNDDDQQQNEEKKPGSETSEQNEVVTHRNYSFSGVKNHGSYNDNVMKF